jgi:hypothetical protein
VIEKRLLDGFTEIDRSSLASVADHPGVSVWSVLSLPEAGGVPLVAEVLTAGQSRAWACPADGFAVPNQDWGRSDEPLIAGPLEPLAIDGWKRVSPDDIRPIRESGDRELEVRQELNGPIQTFGQRFWNLVAKGHSDAKRAIQGSSAEVVSVSYVDRYLYSPVSIRILHQIVEGLRHAVGESRWAVSEFKVNTTRPRPDTDGRKAATVNGSWNETEMRDGVAQKILEPLGEAVRWIVKTQRETPHGRSFLVTFSDGSELTVRLDQGVDFWKAPDLRRSGRRTPTDFDFGDPDLSRQAEAIRKMTIPVEGGAFPTQIFVKCRAAKTGRQW